MIPFTFSKKIEFIITDNVIEDATTSVVSAIANRIKAEKPSNLTSNQFHITFSGGSFREVPNIRWNILSPIHHGIIKVIPNKNKLIVSYKLWYTELFIIASVMSVLAALLFMISSGFSIQNLWGSITVWAFLYLGNYVVSIIRFDVFIHSTLNKLNAIMYNEYRNHHESV